MPEPLLDVSRATVSIDADGSVAFDDPDAPLVAAVWTTGDAYPIITRIVVDSRGPDITGARLYRLPMAQMRYIAAVKTAAAGVGPNEMLYGMLATPRPPSGWDDDHWGRVLDVWRRGEDVDGRGGGVRAVARLWGVTVKPTAYRWLAEAKRRGTASGGLH